MDSLSDLFSSDSWKTYQTYMQEVRPAGIRLLAIFLIGFIGGSAFFGRIVNGILHLFNLKGINVVLTSPYQFFGLALSVGLCAGVLLGGPYALYELIRFARPAMTKQEYGWLKRLLPFIAVLFIVGFCLGAYIIQFVITFYLGISSSLHVNNIWDIEHLLSQILIGGLAMGFIFEVPLVLTFLIRIHVIKVSQLISKRRYAYAAVLFLAVIVPFTNDAISYMVFIVPLLFLFELTVVLNRKYV